MAITLNQFTKTIFIPKADTTLVSSSPDIRSIDIDLIHNELRTVHASEANGIYENTHEHVTPFDLGVFILARVLKILAPWVVEFESTGTPYEVRIIGGNSNITDRRVVNDVSLTPNNSAGFIQVETGVSGLTAEEAATLAKLDPVDVRVYDLWKLFGCMAGNKVTITPTGITTQDGTVIIDFTGDGVSSTTMERQP